MQKENSSNRSYQKRNSSQKRSSSHHRGGLSLNSVLESHNFQGKIKGTPQQLVDKYTSMGKESFRDGDAIAGEKFFQYAEHYRRLVLEISPPRPCMEDMIEKELSSLAESADSVEDISESL